MADLNEFLKWTDRGRRVAEIKLRGGTVQEVWVYDHDLETGQFVEKASEIDLKTARREDAKYKKELAEKILQENP